MKKIVIFIFLTVSTISAASPISSQTLVRGEAKTIQVDYNIGEVAISEDSICDYLVRENRREIYLNPKKEGRASLTLWDISGVKRDDFTISVVAIGLNEILEDAKDTFSSSGALKFSIDGGQVVIKGEVASSIELAKLHSFAAALPQVRLDVNLAKAVLETISTEIEKAISTPGIRVRSIRDKLVLEGTAYNNDAATRVEKIARLYDENIINLISVKESKRSPGAEKLIQLDVQFMEVKKNALRTFGINWAPGSTPSGSASNASLGGGGSSQGGLFTGLTDTMTSLVGFVFNLAPKIKLARQKGDARVLENPSFVVKSGENANFFSGTEVPFYSQQTVVFKDIGVKIDAEPIASNEDVDLKINVTVTSPTAGGVNKGIDTNTISTTAYCRAGQSLALAGIFRNADARMYNRVPEDVNTSSALFTLFLSKDYMSHRSEFVIFVTPRLVDGNSNVEGVTTLKPEDWKEINGEIIKKRSKKEYKKYAGVEKHAPEKIKKEKGEEETQKRVTFELPQSLTK